MIILRFKIRSKPDKRDDLMAALAEIITPARATEGVINFDLARVLPQARSAADGAEVGEVKAEPDRAPVR